MEFFSEIESGNLDQHRLINLLTINSMPELCNSIEAVLEDAGDKGVIFCLWGKHNVVRMELVNGIRFSIPDCPNALAWSITADQATNTATIHCTINAKEHDEDFIESIQEFVNDWAIGINNFVINNMNKINRAAQSPVY